MHIIYIGIGTNLENPGRVVRWTLRRLVETFPGEHRFSSPQQTVPVNFPSRNNFTNFVARITTDVPPERVKPLLKKLERQFGRTPEDKSHGVVKIDLDLLCLDGVVLKPGDWERDYMVAARAEVDA